MDAPPKPPDLPLDLKGDVVVHPTHALHLVSRPGATGDLRDAVLSQPGGMCVPPFVEGEARQDRRDV